MLIYKIINRISFFNLPRQIVRHCLGRSKGRSRFQIGIVLSLSGRASPGVGGSGDEGLVSARLMAINCCAITRARAVRDAVKNYLWEFVKDHKIWISSSTIIV